MDRVNLPGVNLNPILKEFPTEAGDALLRDGHWITKKISIFAKHLGVSEDAVKNAKFIPKNGEK